MVLALQGHMLSLDEILSKSGICTRMLCEQQSVQTPVGLLAISRSSFQLGFPILGGHLASSPTQTASQTPWPCSYHLGRNPLMHSHLGSAVNVQSAQHKAHRMMNSLVISKVGCQALTDPLVSLLLPNLWHGRHSCHHPWPCQNLQNCIPSNVQLSKCYQRHWRFLQHQLSWLVSPPVQPSLEMSGAEQACLNRLPWQFLFLRRSWL